MNRFAMVVVVCLVMVLQIGCGMPGKKSENVKAFSDSARKTSASGAVTLAAKSEDPTARTRIKADGIEIDAPGTVETRIGFDTAEKVREQSDTDTKTEFYKKTSIGIKILAAVLIAVGLFLAIKFSPVLGISVGAVGGLLLAIEMYPWLIFAIMAAVVACAGYLIYDKYATEGQKEETQATIDRLQDALASVVAAVEQSASGIKEAVTNKVAENADDPDEVKDTITEIKRTT